MSSTLAEGAEPVEESERSNPAGGLTNDLLERCGWSLVWVGVLLTGLWSSNNWLESPWEAWVAPLTIAIGIGGGAWIWAARGEITRRVRITSIAAALLASFAPWISLKVALLSLLPAVLALIRYGGKLFNKPSLRSTLIALALTVISSLAAATLQLSAPLKIPETIKQLTQEKINLGQEAPAVNTFMESRSESVCRERVSSPV